MADRQEFGTIDSSSENRNLENFLNGDVPWSAGPEVKVGQDSEETSPLNPEILASLMGTGGSLSPKDLEATKVLVRDQGLSEEAAATIVLLKKTLATIQLPERQLERLATTIDDVEKKFQEISKNPDESRALLFAPGIVLKEIEDLPEERSTRQQLRSFFSKLKGKIPGLSQQEPNDRNYRHKNASEEEQTRLGSLEDIRISIYEAIEEMEIALRIYGVENPKLRMQGVNLLFKPLLALAMLREKVSIARTFDELVESFWLIRCGYYFIDRKGEVPFGEDVLDKNALTEHVTFFQQFTIPEKNLVEGSRWRNLDESTQKAILIYGELYQYAKRPEFFKIDDGILNVQLWLEGRFLKIRIPLEDLWDENERKNPNILENQQRCVHSIATAIKMLKTGNGVEEGMIVDIGKRGKQRLRHLATKNRDILGKNQLFAKITDADVNVYLDNFPVDDKTGIAQGAKHEVLSFGSRSFEGFGVTTQNAVKEDGEVLEASSIDSGNWFGRVNGIVSAAAHAHNPGGVEHSQKVQEGMFRALPFLANWPQEAPPKDFVPKYTPVTMGPNFLQAVENWKQKLAAKEHDLSLMPKDFYANLLIPNEKVKHWKNRVKNLKKRLLFESPEGAEKSVLGFLALNDFWPFAQMLRTGEATLHSVASRKIQYKQQEVEVIDILTAVLPADSSMLNRWSTLRRFWSIPEAEQPQYLERSGFDLDAEVGDFMESLVYYLWQKGEVAFDGKPSKNAVFAALGMNARVVEGGMVLGSKGTTGDAGSEVIRDPGGMCSVTATQLKEMSSQDRQRYPTQKNFFSALYNSYEGWAKRVMGVANGHKDGVVLGWSATFDMAMDVLGPSIQDSVRLKFSRELKQKLSAIQPPLSSQEKEELVLELLGAYQQRVIDVKTGRSSTKWDDLLQSYGIEWNFIQSDVENSIRRIEEVSQELKLIGQVVGAFSRRNKKVGEDPTKLLLLLWKNSRVLQKFWPEKQAGQESTETWEQFAASGLVRRIEYRLEQQVDQIPGDVEALISMVEYAVDNPAILERIWKFINTLPKRD